MDRLQLTVDNKDLANFDDPLFEFGAKLRVAWGNGASASPVREMVIRKVTGGRELTVHAVSRKGSLMDTIKRRRRFENVRRSDVVAQVARENGFDVPDIEETPEVFPSIAQSNLTDGQLIRKLAHLEGFEFYIDFDGLHFHRRRVDQAPIRSYTYFTDPEGGEIIDFNVENDVTRRPGKVTVKSRDPITKEDIEASASDKDDPDRDVLAGQVGVIDGETGKLVVSKPEIAQETTIPSNAQSQADAEREAKGAYRKTSQRAVKLTLKLRGDPSLVAKTVIDVNGLGRRLSGKYYVREAVHALDATGGYDLSIKCITDGFQGGQGKGKGAGAEEGSAFATLAAELREAALSDLSVGVDGETGQLVGDVARLQAVQRTANALADGAAALQSNTGEQLVANANRLAAALQRLAANASGAGAKATAAAANNGGALCRRVALAASGEVQAKGRLNTKTVDDSEVRPVKTTDLDGREVTRYERTGGRER